MSVRLFTAVNFSEPIKGSLCGIIDKFKSLGADGNFSRRDNLHLTLVFIGETNRVSELKGMLDRLEASPFELPMGGIGTFRRDGGDILWYGINAVPELIKLQGDLNSMVKKAGFKVDARKYTPHLTLGREIIFPKGFVKPSVPELCAYVESVSLMKSEHRNGKLVYTEIYSKKCK